MKGSFNKWPSAAAPVMLMIAALATSGGSTETRSQTSWTNVPKQVLAFCKAI